VASHVTCFNSTAHLYMQKLLYHAYVKWRDTSSRVCPKRRQRISERNTRSDFERSNGQNTGQSHAQPPMFSVSRRVWSIKRLQRAHMLHREREIESRMHRPGVQHALVALQFHSHVCTESLARRRDMVRTAAGR
jgi:hypothetical protein